MTLTWFELSAMIDDFELTHRKEDILELCQSSLRIQLTETPDNEISVGASKFGGMPDLPPQIKFPEYERQPFEFIAQINLADIEPFALKRKLPSTTSIIYFFYKSYDDNLQWVGKEAIYFYTGNMSEIQRVSRPNMVYEGRIYQPCKVTLIWELTFCDFLDSAYCEYFGDTDNDDKKYRELFWAVGRLLGLEPIHQIFGNPQSIQDSPFEDCSNSFIQKADIRDAYLKNPANWELLLQIDTDKKFGTGWGDNGRLFFCIPRHELKQGIFDNAIAVIQRY